MRTLLSPDTVQCTCTCTYKFLIAHIIFLVYIYIGPAKKLQQNSYLYLTSILMVKVHKLIAAKRLEHCIVQIWHAHATCICRHTVN